MRSAQRRPSSGVLHTQHRRRVDRFAFEDALGDLSFRSQTEHLSATARRACRFPAVRPRAATARACRGRPRRPALSARTRSPHPACPTAAPWRTRPMWRRRSPAPGGRRRSSRRSAPARRMSCRSRGTPRRCAGSTEARSGSLPYGADSTRASASFRCLTISVAQPSPKLSNVTISTPRAPSMDHKRHFDGAGVGTGNDPQPPVGRHPQDGARQGDDLGQSRLRFRGAMAAAEQGARQRVQRKAGTFGAGAGGKIGIRRTDVRCRGACHCGSPLQKKSVPVGGRDPPPHLGARPDRVNMFSSHCNRACQTSHDAVRRPVCASRDARLGAMQRAITTTKGS